MNKDRIEISVGGETFPVEHFVFPGGELQVQIPRMEDGTTGDLLCTARLSSAEGLLKLLMAAEILGRSHRGRDTLALPYFPYAQQDRVMCGHEAFSLKVAACIVNAMMFDRVVVCDPHSDVTPALVNRVHVIHQHEIVADHPEMIRALRRDDAIIVAPDAGAAKKAFKAASYFGREMICGTKVRNTSDGSLSRIELPEAARCADRRAVIVDDICVGGATFVGLARTLREAGASKVLLYVTHGVFSRGLEPFVGLIDWILTTDTFAGCPDRGTSEIPLYSFPIDGLIRSRLN